MRSASRTRGERTGRAATCRRPCQGEERRNGLHRCLPIPRLIIIGAREIGALTAIKVSRGCRVLRRSIEFTQYSVAFGERCKKMGVRPSMGAVGDAYDNAMAESFFATLECELIDRRSWQTKTEARFALFTYIDGWYNPRRRHSALGQISPAKFERSHQDKPAHATVEPRTRLDHRRRQRGVRHAAGGHTWTLADLDTLAADVQSHDTYAYVLMEHGRARSLRRARRQDVEFHHRSDSA